MRKFSPTILSLLDSPINLKFFFLIELGVKIPPEDPEDPITYATKRFTTNAYPLTYGGNLYLKDISLSYYEAPKFNSITEKGSYKISIIDNSDELSALTNFSLVGQPLVIRVGFFDGNGNPLLGTNDVALAYSGFIDNVNKVDDFDTKIINFEGSSPMAHLDLVNLFVTSRNGMDQKNRDDTSFDTIFAEDDINVKWGKI